MEIAALAWLVNGPKAAVTVIDARGYPLSMWVTDPRAFALHKTLLSERADRDPLRRQRDAAQGHLVATRVRTGLPALRFDDPALAALPLTLRARATTLAAEAAPEPEGEPRLEPAW